MRHALCHFVVDGAVAQLGERQNRTLEAAGSIPVCSTKKKGVNSNRLAPYSFEQYASMVCTNVCRYPIADSLPLSDPISR